MEVLSTVIVPVHQEVPVLRLFLDSLGETIEESTQVLAVNDGSGQATQDLLEERLTALKSSHDQVTFEIVQHAHPRGCASSINEVLPAALGEYVFLVDSDIILAPGWQPSMRASLNLGDDIGMTGAVLLYPQTGGIQHCGVAFTESMGRHLFLNADPGVLPDEPYEVQLVVFALFAMKGRVHDEVGLLDERFFNGYEDFDYQMRARALGYRTVVDPRVRAYHWERSNGIHRAGNRKSNLGRFWKRWGASLHEDLWDHLFARLGGAIGAGQWRGVDLAEARSDAEEFWWRLGERAVDLSHTVRSGESVLLPQVMPEHLSNADERLLLLVDNFVKLLDNRLWFERRLAIRADDVIADLYGNVVSAAELCASSWPGTKIR